MCRSKVVGDVHGLVGLQSNLKAEHPGFKQRPRVEVAVELLGEDPPVAGVTDPVDDGPPDGDVLVGLVQVAAAPSSPLKFPVTTISGR